MSPFIFSAAKNFANLLLSKAATLTVCDKIETCCSSRIRNKVLRVKKLYELMETSTNLLIKSGYGAVSRKKDEKAGSMLKYIRWHGFHAGCIAQWERVNH